MSLKINEITVFCNGLYNIAGELGKSEAIHKLEVSQEAMHFVVIGTINHGSMKKPLLKRRKWACLHPPVGSTHQTGHPYITMTWIPCPPIPWGGILLA
jgi:hypothetical protein